MKDQICGGLVLGYNDGTGKFIDMTSLLPFEVQMKYGEIILG